VGTIPGHVGEPVDPIEQLRARTPLPAPPFPALPRDWMFDSATREHGREVLRQWREEQRRWREEVRGRGGARSSVRMAALEMQQYEIARRSPEERILRVRRQLAGGGVTIAMLAAINAVVTPGFPWVLFPAIGIGFGMLRHLANLWADGIPLSRLASPSIRPAVAGTEQPLRRLEPKLPAPAAATATEAVLDSVPQEVLDGRQGQKVRDAYAARAAIRSVLARLPEAERALLPEIQPTVESLVERVRTLAAALHALDSDASPDALVKLQLRITEAEAMPADAPERARRLELLQRQQRTLTDLAERRGTLQEQLDHALIVLETMKLDLARLRNSGVEARLADQGPVTQEMRALARDVQRVAEAVDETRREG